LAVILIADDDPVLRRLVTLHLAGAGHRFVEAGNGRDALSHFASGEVDLLIVDHMMPLGDGPFIVRQVRAGPRRMSTANGAMSPLLWSMFGA
jgi:CheY-like chemotaxis protein